MRSRPRGYGTVVNKARSSRMALYAGLTLSVALVVGAASNANAYSTYELWHPSACFEEVNRVMGRSNGVLHCPDISTDPDCAITCPTWHDNSTRVLSKLEKVEVDVKVAANSGAYAYVCSTPYNGAVECATTEYVSSSAGYQTITFDSTNLSGIRGESNWSSLMVHVYLDKDDYLHDYIVYWE